MKLQRQAVVAIDPKHEPGMAKNHADVPKTMVDELTLAVARQVAYELHGRHLAITNLAVKDAFWIVTCHPDDVDMIPQADDCTDGKGCATCLAGRDQAKAYLAEHPGLHVAIGLVSFEVT